MQKSRVEPPIAVAKKGLPTTPQLVPRSLARVRRLSASWVVFGTAFVLYAFIGWVGAFVLQTYNYDGLARITQAYGVLFSRDPHLAALGFIWMPLPALSNIPLVFLLKPLGLVLWAGPLMSSIYTAFALAQLYEILSLLELPPFWRVVWIIIFGAHPLIVHVAAMGLSEAPFMAFLFLSVKGFLLWERKGQTAGVHWAGIGAALAVLCRYEALAWVGVGALLFVWHWWLNSHRIKAQTLEANLLAFLISPSYAVMIWAFMNWQIMGNPIHFLVGPGSTATTPDTAQAVGPTHPFAYAQSSVVGSGLLMLRQISDLGPLLLPATALLLVCVMWKRSWADLGYLALAWSILGFTFFTAWRGLLPPFTRYFLWLVPAGVIVAGMVQRFLSKGWLRDVTAAGIALLLFVPTILLPLQTVQRLPDPFPQRIIGAVLMPPEVTDYRQVRGQLDEFKTMADYLNAQPLGKLTMIDAAIGSPIVLYLKRPASLVMTTDQDFFPILYSPVGHVDQILIPRPSFGALGRSDIYRIYPDLYDGESWARLITEFPGPNAWRLYKVVKP